jgi:23S rRNA (uracil1939-C5)-methyltransferase
MSALTRVTIESIAAGGDGIARANGMAVFVPRTAPGDVADVRITSRGRFGRGDVVHLVQPAESRVAPRCRHYTADRCGGCQLQHLDYASQLKAKQHIVRDALARIARREVTLPTISASPATWAYRSKLTLTMRQGTGTWVFGLHSYDDPSHVFQLRECPITDPVLVAAWREVHAAACSLPAARALRAAVRLVDNEVAFLLEGGREWDHARDFSRRCPSLHLIRWSPEDGEARVVVDRRRGTVPATAFEQVNSQVAALVREAVVSRTLNYEPKRVLDLYAGNALTGALIARRGVEVVAVEMDHEAAAYATQHAPPGMAVRTARVETVLDQLLPADVVILNPPRTGVDRQVSGFLESGPRPRALLYVSCDPATLARDTARLPGYRVSSVHCFDMFPQTAHVETVCELVPVPS